MQVAIQYPFSNAELNIKQLKNGVINENEKLKLTQSVPIQFLFLLITQILICKYNILANQATHEIIRAGRIQLSQKNIILHQIETHKDKQTVANKMNLLEMSSRMIRMKNTKK